MRKTMIILLAMAILIAFAVPTFAMENDSAAEGIPMPTQEIVSSAELLCILGVAGGVALVCMLYFWRKA